MSIPRPAEAVRTAPPLPGPPPLPRGSALFLDFDGTLVELAQRPEHVVVSPELPALLETLADHLGGAVAIITGRWLADVDGLLAPMVLPGAGLHGAELRERDTARVQVREVPGLSAIAQALRERFGGDPRLLVEDKGAAVALHFRQAPERAAECTAALRAAAAPFDALEVIDGNQVVEARAHGADKGQALRRLMWEAPFAARTPVFVGDDRSDEDAFAVAAQLGGYGVKVGVGPTLARYRCAGVREVHAWLRTSATG